VPHFQQLHHFDLFASFHATERYEAFVKFPQELNTKENEVRKISENVFGKYPECIAGWCTAFYPC
jgi:hypothetical protein